MTQENNEKFDINIVYEKFIAAVHEEDDVHLQLYLESFEELNKFFTLMGTVFGFVSKDLKAKMDILNEFLKDSNKSDNFSTVKKMIEYEVQNDLLNKRGYISGCRTLLRLHRGLGPRLNMVLSSGIQFIALIVKVLKMYKEDFLKSFLQDGFYPAQGVCQADLLRRHNFVPGDFIQLFLKKLGDLKDGESTSTACREAYDETLAKHHPFVIRNGAKVAIYTLPTRELLLKRVCGELENIQRSMDMLPQTLEATSVVHKRIDKLYSVNNLHTLP